MKKRKIRTMKDLSATIGISRPTLSRFFQDAESVRQSTRARIEQAMETVDYVPNFFATKMNRRSTGLIGVIVPHINDLFFTSLIEEIEAAALQADYMVITQNSHGDPSLEARAVQNLISMSADGVIVAPIGEASEIESFERLRDELPVLFVDSRFPERFDDVDFVGTNNVQSIGLIVDYLCRSGDGPAFFGMPPLNSNSFEREAAYTKKMNELEQISEIIDISRYRPGWNFEEFAYTAMDDFFKNGRYIDRTILFANDRLAIGAMRAANKHSLFSQSKRGSGKFRIAGHDDHPLSAYVYPSLTTVSQNTKRIAAASVARLMATIAEGGRRYPAIEQVFDAELQIRDSA
jgi:DNA-binding LacI/PurR family transcriptional regulator